MRTLVAAVVLFGQLGGMANAETPARDYSAQREARSLEAARSALAEDARLAKLTDATPQKIGILTYYRNAGGGYTFLERERILFYSLPFLPGTYQADNPVHPVLRSFVRQKGDYGFPENRTLGIIGTRKMPFGGQTMYRTEMTRIVLGVRRREDVPIAKWSRDSPDGNFRLSILAEENETRLKLKSIVPVLESHETH